jgi:23S rRNA pseudouridine2605 synthase
VLDEGRNREIRRLLARIGHKVLRLKRVALGPLRLGELAPGEYRPLTHDELRALRLATTPGGRRRQGKPRREEADSERTEPRPAGAQPRATQGRKPPAKPAAPRRPTIIGGDEPRPAGPARRKHKRPARPGAARPRRPS